MLLVLADYFSSVRRDCLTATSHLYRHKLIDSGADRSEDDEPALAGPSNTANREGRRNTRQGNDEGR